ncbi:hypothetical protein BDZ91DRAFT_167207 [Kalaharituber pfeilii]|nr:hypothetical protein BDZ91DRAFT_167207 [Kalaharituber pfeilii]
MARGVRCEERGEDAEHSVRRKSEGYWSCGLALGRMTRLGSLNMRKVQGTCSSSVRGSNVSCECKGFSAACETATVKSSFLSPLKKKIFGKEKKKKCNQEAGSVSKIWHGRYVFRVFSITRVTNVLRYQHEHALWRTSTRRADTSTNLNSLAVTLF